MSPLLPAVRARHAERHPALDVGIPRDPHDLDLPSPGAGSTPDWDWKEYDEQLPDPDPLQPTNVTENTSSSSIQGPTTVTVVQVSPVFGIPTISLSSSSLVPSSTLPAVTTPSVSSSSSSSPPAANTSTFTSSTTTPQDTGRSSQRPTTTSATAAATENPLRNGATGAVRTSSGLSGGAIAAIVIVLLLAMGALAFLLLRRRRIQRRSARRATWTVNAWQPPTADESLEKAVTELNPTSLPDIDPAAGAPSPSTRGNDGGAARPPAIPIILRKSPPSYIPQTPVTTQQPRSYFSPVDSSAPSPQPSAARTMGSESTQDATVLVRVTFVPQLPDELAITPGETLYIRTEFDDGWAYCANPRGEEGMVPLECLEGAGGQFAEFPPVDWHNRDSRRVSSLRSPRSPVA